MIRVGFIGAVSKEWMGGLNYFKNLLYAISNFANQEVEIVVFVGRKTEDSIKSMFSEYATVIEDSLFDRKSFRWYCWRVCAKVFKRQYLLDALLERHGIEVLSHSYLVGLSSCKTVNWIPDFQHKHLPQMFTDKELQKRDRDFRYLVRQSDRIVLSSQDAFKDYCEYAPSFVEKARVLQFVSQPSKNFFELKEGDESALRKKYAITGEYFYLPNQFWKHKNHEVAFKAIAVLKDEGLSVTLVCSGHLRDYRNLNHVGDLQKYIEEYDLVDNIRLLGLVDYKDVFALIKYSKAVINPSLFEGWSSTVEECKSVGKAMILSDIAVHREQYPQACFFERESPRSLADKIKECLSFPVERSLDFNLKKKTEEFATKYVQIVKELV